MPPKYPQSHEEVLLDQRIHILAGVAKHGRKNKSLTGPNLVSMANAELFSSC
jgi:hypothetical protein